MIRLIIAALSISTLIFSVSCKEKSKVNQSAFAIQSIVGDVRVETAIGAKTASLGQELSSNDSIITAKMSSVDILCASEGVIRLHESSTLKISSFSKLESGLKTSLKLDNGKVFASFAKLSKDSEIQIKTPTAVAAVRGTSFRVTTDSKKASIAVLSGKVQVNPVKNDEIIETSSKIIEQNSTAEISKTDVTDIVSAKKEIAVTVLKTSEIEEIKAETAGIAVSKSAPEDLKKELDSVGIKSVEVEVKPLPVEKAEAPVSSVEKNLPVETASNKDIKKEKELVAEKARIAKEKADKAKLEAEKAEKAETARLEAEKAEKAEKARIEAEKIEKAKIQKENRVKNIPNI